MKKNTKPPTLSRITPLMIISWKEFCGEARMPRSPEKLIRKLIRFSDKELRDISYLFKAIVSKQFENQCFALSLIFTELDAMEKKFAELYDAYPGCRARYRNRLDRSMCRLSHYRYQAMKLYTHEDNRRFIEVLTPEVLLLEKYEEDLSIDFFIFFAPFVFN